MKIRHVAIALCALVAIIFGSMKVYADLSYTAGSGTTIFDFICFTTKHCPIAVPTNSAGTEIMTAANPGQVTGANGTFPVNPSTIASWGLMSGTSAGTAPTNTMITGGIYNTSTPAPTNGQTVPLQLDSSGNLQVNVKAGGGSGGTSSSINATYPATGTAMGAEYLSSPPSLTSGQMVALQTTVAGSLHTTVDNVNANGAASASNSSPVTPANPPPGAGSIATGQVSVASTATSIISARTGVGGTGRVSATICNTGSVAVYIGTSGVTTATGQYLAGVAGACLTLNTTAQIYGIVTTGTETVSFIETF